jgi:hypothetical protein
MDDHITTPAGTAIVSHCKDTVAFFTHMYYGG